MEANGIMQPNDILADAFKAVNQAEKDSIWVQKSIGAGLVLCGFFEFHTKQVAKKTVVKLTNVSSKNILRFLEMEGFKKRYMPKSNDYLLVKVEDNVMHEVTYDIIKNCTYREMLRHETIHLNFVPLEDDGENEGGSDFFFDTDLLETVYLRTQHNVFNKNILELMSEFTVKDLKDTDDLSYFLFENCMVEVSKESYRSLPYSGLKELDRCVWKNHIKERRFNPYSGTKISQFEKFIKNVSNNEQDRFNAFRSGIGYLLHAMNGPEKGQAVVCYDEAPTDRKNPQGGTGKGLFAQGIANMREIAEIDGKHFKADDKYRFSTVSITTQVVAVDDLNKDCSFDTFFSCLTNGFTIEEKHVNKIKILAEDSPKVLFSMNTVIESGGTSTTRRIFVLEFSNHYSSKIITGAERPIEDEHGGRMFSKKLWDSNEWDAFTTFMIECVSFYLNKDLQPYDLRNVATNSLIQTDGEEFFEWVNKKDFEPNVYYKTTELFLEFKEEYLGKEHPMTQLTFTNKIKRYAKSRMLHVKTQRDSYTKISEFVLTETNPNIP